MPDSPALITPSSAIVFLGIDDAEHFSDAQKAELLTRYPEHERLARLYGIPQLGSGAVFPLPEDRIVCDDIPVPTHWAQIAGLDFGWDHPTAGANLAWNRDADIVYITKTYARSKASPLEHAAALKPWGDWLPWAWPHDGLARGRDGADALADQYRKTGMKLLSEHATFPSGGNDVEAGIMEMLARLETDRLKVFKSCVGFLAEYRMYHRKDGKLVKLQDDIISASRYALMMLRYARAKAPPKESRYGRGRAHSTTAMSA